VLVIDEELAQATEARRGRGLQHIAQACQVRQRAGRKRLVFALGCEQISEQVAHAIEHAERQRREPALEQRHVFFAAAPRFDHRFATRVTCLAFALRDEGERCALIGELEARRKRSGYEARG
jgi:hypothetical protein